MLTARCARQRSRRSPTSPTRVHNRRPLRYPPPFLADLPRIATATRIEPRPQGPCLGRGSDRHLQPDHARRERQRPGGFHPERWVEVQPVLASLLCVFGVAAGVGVSFVCWIRSLRRRSTPFHAQTATPYSAETCRFSQDTRSFSWRLRPPNARDSIPLGKPVRLTTSINHSRVGSAARGPCSAA